MKRDRYPRGGIVAASAVGGAPGDEEDGSKGY